MNLLRYKKKLLVITTSRSDFGLLKNTILSLKNSKKFNLKILVTGNHFIPEFGVTKKEVVQLKNTKKVYLKSLYLSKFKKFKINFNFNSLLKFLNDFKPNLAIVLGDRFEVLMISSFLSTNKIPIAHISGGDLTFNSLDDNFRHAITKLSSIHFTESKESKKILIQLGEDKKNIFEIGSLSREAIEKNKYVSKSFLEKKYKFKIDKKIILITIHPISDVKKNFIFIENVFKFIKKISSDNSLKFVITYPNSDPGYKNIITEIKKFTKNKKFLLVKNLGITDYLSFLRISELSMGNSSSCLIDAYYMKKKSLILGDRQNGRNFNSKLILTTNYKYKDILRKFEKIIKMKNNYRIKSLKDEPSKKIAKILTNIKFPLKVVKKFKIK